jgi:hypothetical protein
LKNKLLAELSNFRGNELVTVRISAFCGAILSNNSGAKLVILFWISNKTDKLFLTSLGNPMAVEVILVPLVIPARLPPSKRLGSHEPEITDIGTGNNFGHNRTTF